jgi:hypothetical protein
MGAYNRPGRPRTELSSQAGRRPANATARAERHRRNGPSRGHVPIDNRDTDPIYYDSKASALSAKGA